MNERHTMQKDIIYSSLCSLANHPTAEQVYERVHIGYPSISKATVYRVLNQMAQNGTILKISINDGADCFDHQTFDHHHGKCSCCGRVCDVPFVHISLPKASDDYEGEFDIQGYSLQFSGICSSCKKGKTSNG